MRIALAVSLLVATFGTVVAAQDGAFAAPEHARPAARFGDRVLDCAAHGAWMEPEGWNVVRTDGGDVLALEPHGRAILVRVQTRSRTTHVRTTEDFVRIANEVASHWAPGSTFSDAVEHPRSRWHVDRRIEGTATVHGTAMHLIAESRGERQLWVAIHPADARTLGGDLDAAMTSFLPLTSHACACDYDCERRPTTP
jgi:hypothetical protein